MFQINIVVLPSSRNKLVEEHRADLCDLFWLVAQVLETETQGDRVAGRLEDSFAVLFCQSAQLLLQVLEADLAIVEQLLVGLRAHGQEGDEQVERLRGASSARIQLGDSIDRTIVEGGDERSAHWHHQILVRRLHDQVDSSLARSLNSIEEFKIDCSFDISIRFSH